MGCGGSSATGDKLKAIGQNAAADAKEVMQEDADAKKAELEQKKADYDAKQAEEDAAREAKIKEGRQNLGNAIADFGGKVAGE